MNFKYFAATIAIAVSSSAMAQKVEQLRFGDFEQWVTRHVHESAIIGGKDKTIYEIGPTRTIDGAVAYVPQGGTPWATSNVLAKVAGITKTSNAVFPDTRSGGGKCAKLCTQMETCRAAGVINIDVVVAGTMFLGRMFEPIKSTSEPYSKMEMGVPFTKRPRALKFDYRLSIPDTDERVYSSGFSAKRTIKGHDNAEVFILLQHRWEDEKGNIYANRVGTGRQKFTKSTSNWVNGYSMTVHYGDITQESFYRSYMGLIPEKKSYYARNSKGKMVPVKEVDWADANDAPTHMIIMFSAGSGEPYTGTIGLTFWVDNVGLVY
jgi:hypothetical protein